MCSHIGDGVRSAIQHSDTILALGAKLTANYDLLIVNAARLTMLHMHTDAELAETSAWGFA